MPFLRRYRVLQLLLLNSYCIGRSAPCDSEPVELLQRRRRHLQQQQDQAQPTEAPYNPLLLFDGNLRDDLGQPVEDAQIQFWQADYHGNYFHPGDPLDGKELMTDSFSYFGTATTDAKGDFDFKTYRPGIYVQRPVTHIHFKVFYNKTEILTSQFYFEDENVGRWYDEMLILKQEEDVDEDGTIFTFASKQVVVNMGKGGSTKLTPWQQDGPFYPLVDFFDVGNDMTSGLLKKFLTSEPPTSATIGSSTNTPTREPTRKPTRKPTSEPTRKTTSTPTSEPTRKTTRTPTNEPTRKPTRTPTSEPTRKPTRTPTRKPTRTPTGEPTRYTPTEPTRKPTRESILNDWMWDWREEHNSPPKEFDPDFDVKDLFDFLDPDGPLASNSNATDDNEDELLDLEQDLDSYFNDEEKESDVNGNITAIHNENYSNDFKEMEEPSSIDESSSTATSESPSAPERVATYDKQTESITDREEELDQKPDIDVSLMRGVNSDTSPHPDDEGEGADSASFDGNRFLRSSK